MVFRSRIGIIQQNLYMGNQSILLDLKVVIMSNKPIALVLEVQSIARELKEKRNILKVNLVKFSVGLSWSCGKMFKWSKGDGRSLTPECRASNNPKLLAFHAREVQVTESGIQINSTCNFQSFNTVSKS